MLPLFKVFMAPSVGDAVKATLYGGYITQGPVVERVEGELRTYLGVPNVLTLNSCTSALTLAYKLLGIEPGNYIITTALSCFSQHTGVVMADNTIKKIRELVNSKSTEKVKSLNLLTRQFEDKKIIGWTKLLLKNADWFRIKTLGRFGIWITGDHQILTENGYKRVDSLLPTDKLATKFGAPNNKQLEVVSGSLLGDSYLDRIEKKKKTSRLSFRHTKAQKEWFDLKIKSLNGIQYHIYHANAYKRTKESYCYFSTANPYFNELREKWYPNGKKIVPRDLKLTPLMLATWYMDDGSLCINRAILCTEGFSKEDVEFLKDCLQRDFNIKAIPFVKKRHGKVRGYSLGIGNGVDKHNSALKFFDIIAPYIPETMRYKLPEEMRWDDFDPKLWDLGCADILFKNYSIERKTPSTRGKEYRYVYCLEVEDNHNFIANQIVVANCSATVTAAVTLGAKIIWADVGSRSGNISSYSIEQRLEQFGYLPIKAIVPVHWAGQPCDLAQINALGNDFGIAVVEDAAHAFGAEYQGKRLGAHSDMVSFSHQAIKHVSAIDGGLLVCKDPAAHSRGKLLRWFGIDRDSPKEDERIEQDIKEAGYKFHMNDVNATVLSENLQHADYVIGRHRYNGQYYDCVLQDLPGITLVERPPDRVSSYWVYTLLVDQRDRFRQAMLEAGIQCSQVHSRLDRHTAFRSSLGCDLPGLDEFAQHQISIPCHWGLTEENLDYISQTVKRVAKKLHS